jgi:hypothetical protein
MQMGAMQVRPGQYVAYPGAVSPYQTDMTSMISQIMPLIILMMLFGMIMPMFKGMTESAK